MRTLIGLTALLALPAALAAQSVESNIDPGGNFAWGENVGWINFRGEGVATDDALPPPTVGPQAMTGYAWGENIGWINLGDGTNTDSNGFGVIVDSMGRLSGYAWGENVGWINFGTGFGAAGVDPADQPAVDLTTGEFTGFLWGENIGWINLDGSGVDPQAQVQALPPTPPQIANGLVGKTVIPLFSDRNTDAKVDSADVVHRVNNP